jgi:hypothetical protein
MFRKENIMVLRKEPGIFVRTGFTDMRKQINGLSAMARELRPEGPFGGAYYLFCGKTRKKLKILYWEKTGFCLWQKRLEKDSFPWPKNGGLGKEATAVIGRQYGIEGEMREALRNGGINTDTFVMRRKEGAAPVPGYTV